MSDIAERIKALELELAETETAIRAATRQQGDLVREFARDPGCLSKVKAGEKKLAELQSTKKTKQDALSVLFADLAAEVKGRMRGRDLANRARLVRLMQERAAIGSEIDEAISALKGLFKRYDDNCAAAGYACRQVAEACARDIRNSDDRFQRIEDILGLVLPRAEGRTRAELVSTVLSAPSFALSAREDARYINERFRPESLEAAA